MPHIWCLGSTLEFGLVPTSGLCLRWKFRPWAAPLCPLPSQISPMNYCVVNTLDRFMIIAAILSPFSFVYGYFCSLVDSAYNWLTGSASADHSHARLTHSLTCFIIITLFSIQTIDSDRTHNKIQLWVIAAVAVQCQTSPVQSSPVRRDGQSKTDRQVQ
jgi:hypothetical protein